jgi:hypothetical protein
MLSSPNHASLVLRTFLKNFSSTKVTIGELKDALASKAFAILMLIFALPNLVPMPIPGISTIFGTPLVFLSYQLMRGYKAPWFPKWLSNHYVEVNKIERVLLYILPYMQQLERILKPRLSFFIQPFIQHIVASICLVMAVIMILPIPLGNFFPAFSIFFFSLSILERDGLLVLMGLISATISIILISTVVLTSLKGSQYFLENLL